MWCCLLVAAARLVVGTGAGVLQLVLLLVGMLYAEPEVLLCQGD